MMKPCQKCLENNWTFEKIEDMVRATCEMCGYIAEWFPQPKRRDVCRKCGGKTIYKTATEKQIKKKKKRLESGKIKYYFTGWYWCYSCRQIYLDPKAKVST